MHLYVVRKMKVFEGVDLLGTLRFLKVLDTIAIVIYRYDWICIVRIVEKTSYSCFTLLFIGYI